MLLKKCNFSYILNDFWWLLWFLIISYLIKFVLLTQPDTRLGKLGLSLWSQSKCKHFILGTTKAPWCVIFYHENVGIFLNRDQQSLQFSVFVRYFRFVFHLSCCQTRGDIIQGKQLLINIFHRSYAMDSISLLHNYITV